MVCNLLQVNYVFYMCVIEARCRFHYFLQLMVEIMRKQHLGLSLGLSLLITLCCLQLTAQESKNPTFTKARYSEEFIHHARELYDWNAFEINLANRLHITQADCNNFIIYAYKK